MSRKLGARQPEARRVRKRRKPNKEWLEIFEDMRRRTARYGDEQLRVRTIEFYEALPDDKPADLIIAIDVLEHMISPEEHIDKINKLAKKSIIINVAFDCLRGEAQWRKIIESRLNVNDWIVENGRATAVCQAGMRVQGIKAVGAMSDDERWANIEASIKRISKRVGKAPAHDGRALIACYGPSLKDNWERLASERQEGNCVVVSMSGSHDFLIERGIIPDFHVDCDPRPHKAGNLGKPDHRVKYLLASSCDRRFFDMLEGHDISLWHVAVSDHLMRLIDKCGESNESVVSGGGSVGLRAVSLFHGLGYRRFSIYGMDCSFEDAEMQWAGPHASKVNPRAPDLCQVACGDEIFLTSPILATYATNFFDMMKRFDDSVFGVYGRGLLQAMCRKATANTQLEAA